MAMAASPNGSVYHCGSYAVFMSFHAYYTLERCSNTAQPLVPYCLRTYCTVQKNCIPHSISNRINKP